MSKRRLPQGSQCITKYFKLSCDTDDNVQRVSGKELLTEKKKENKTTGNDPLQDESLKLGKNIAHENTEKKEENTSSYKDTELSTENFDTTQNTDEAEENSNMYSRHFNNYNSSPRSYQQYSYNRRGNWDRRDNFHNSQRDMQFYQNEYRNREERQFYGDGNERNALCRPPIRGQRYTENELRYSSNNEYGQYNRSRYYDNDNSNVRLHYDRVNSCENYQHSSYRRQHGSEFDPRRNEQSERSLTRSKDTEYFDRESDKNGGNQKDSHNKSKDDQTLKSIEDDQLKRSPNCEVFSPGSKIYQSDQYYSAEGMPDNIIKKSDENTKNSTPVKSYVKNSSVKNSKYEKSELHVHVNTPNKNIKPETSEKVESDKKIERFTCTSAAEMQGTSPRPALSVVGGNTNSKDKMDFSSFRQALNEVKSPDLSMRSHICKDDEKMVKSQPLRNLCDDTIKPPNQKIPSDGTGKLQIQRKHSDDDLKSPVQNKNNDDSGNSIQRQATDDSGKSPIHRKINDDSGKSPIQRQTTDETGKSPVYRKISDETGKSAIQRRVIDDNGKSPIHKITIDDNGKSPIHRRTSDDTGKSPVHRKISEETGKSAFQRKDSDDNGKSPIHKNTIDDNGKSPIHRRTIDDTGKSPVQRKPSGEKPYGINTVKCPVSESKSRFFPGSKTHALSKPYEQSNVLKDNNTSPVYRRYKGEKMEQSQRNRNSSGDCQVLSPKDRKRSVSGEVKTNTCKKNSSSIDNNKTWTQDSQDSKSEMDDEICLKSALTYPEWKRLKAKKDALQKEKEKSRPFIEIANTPEEYKRLMKQEMEKKKKKDKTQKRSHAEAGKESGQQENECSQLPSLLHNCHNSFKAISATENDGVSDDDIDLEDSEDDDLEAPSFLFSLEEASNRPIPGTPTKLTTDIESPGPSSPLPEPDLTDITKSSLLSSKFSLDQLVSEKVDKSEDQREYEEIHAKLEESVKRGGFVKDTLETVETHEEDILPEHEKHLQEFQILDSVIAEVHPGEVIFQPILYQRLFTGSLSLQTCGFTPGASYIDKYLSTLQPNNYSLLLTSNILKNTLENVSSLEAVLKWVFLLMSIHSNQLVTQGCSKVLLEHLNRQVHFRQTTQTWAPAISDVLAVFCNYGCQVNTLLPESIISYTEDYSSSLTHEDVNGNIPAGENYNMRNLHLVLNIIGQALQAKPRYSNKQLTELLVILCHVALDKSHHREVLPHEFHICIKGILRCYSSNYWESNCNDLCHILFKITTHHHNRLYLAQLFPEDKRGSYIHKWLCYLYLQDTFNVGKETHITDFRIKCLHVFLPKLQSLVETDVYQLASAINYLDIAVGNSTIKVADKEDLQYLSDQLKKISGDVKDSVRMLDRSWVKDMMVRVCSKWTLYLLSVGSKQKSIFAYTKKQVPLPLVEKTVEAVQEDLSSHSEEEENQKDTTDKNDSVDSINLDDNNCCTSETCEDSKIDNNMKNTLFTKIEKPDIIPIIDCDSPMEVDLTEDDDLPDLLDH